MAEMTEQEEMQVFELITAAGGAKSTFMEALYKAKEGKYDEAEKLFKEADGYFIQGHHAHAAMIEAEGQGVETTVRLVLAHAEDQLMSAELTKTMVEEMIALYKRIDALEEALEQKSSKEENRQPFRSGKNKEEFCMKKIVLMCSNGMSTSLMVAKMREAAAKAGYECTINAYSLAAAKEVGTDADCILIGPQVKHKLPQVQKDCPDVPVAAIEMKDYGMMNGAAVLKAARKLMGEEV